MRGETVKLVNFVNFIAHIMVDPVRSKLPPCLYVRQPVLR